MNTNNNSGFLKKITQNPLIYIALSYPYIFVILILFGFLYINNQPGIKQNSFPPSMNDTIKIVQDIGIQDARVTSAVDLATLTAPTPAMLEKGKQLFTTSCSSCHGAEGKGDGAAGVALNPKPRNFTQKDGWKNGRTISMMYKTLQQGVAGSGMPAYDYISAEERIAIISYVRTLMPQPDVDSPADIAKLDETYNLSKGTELPGTIPVPVSEKILLNGNTVKSNSAAKIVSNLSTLKLNNQLLKEVVLDDMKLANSLLNSASWKNDNASFINYLSVNLGKNGLSSSVVTLPKDQIDQLFSILKSLV